MLPVPLNSPSMPVNRFGYSGGPSPSTVFIHGVLGSTSMWKAVASRVSASPSMALPLPGHFPWQQDADDTRRALGDFAFFADYRMAIERDAARPVHLVAHSTGALVALKFAATHPDLVERLTLVGAFSCGRSAARGLMARGVTLPVLGPLMFNALYRGWMHSLATYAHGLSTAKADPAQDAETFERAMLWDLRRSNPAALRAVVSWLAETTITDDLSSVQCPATVVVSQRDCVVRARTQLQLAAALPKGAAIICDAGHLPMFEKPALMRRLAFGVAA